MEPQECAACYISDDAEATGPAPGLYSWLSYGACLVEDTNEQFYAELKPLNRRFKPEAIRIACKGLRLLDDIRKHDPRYDAQSERFDPSLVLAYLQKKGEDPRRAIPRLDAWISHVSRGRTPVEISKPIKFEGGFSAWYFERFLSRNPYGHSGLDINSLYRGLICDLKANASSLVPRVELPHNALEDAIIQARMAKIIIDHITLEQRCRKTEWPD